MTNKLRSCLPPSGLHAPLHDLCRHVEQANWATLRRPRQGLTGRVNHAILSEQATPHTESAIACASNRPNHPAEPYIPQRPARPTFGAAVQSNGVCLPLATS